MTRVTDAALSVAAVLLALLILAALVRAVLGPRFTDRIIAVNVIGTLVVAELAILAVRMREDFLVDVALVYALLNFLTVVVVSRLVLSRPGAAQTRTGIVQTRRKTTWYMRSSL